MLTFHLGFSPIPLSLIVCNYMIVWYLLVTDFVICGAESGSTPLQLQHFGKPVVPYVATSQLLCCKTRMSGILR